MIEVYEIDLNRALAAAEKFKANITPFERVFIMEEGEYGGKKEEIGLGVLALDGGTVLIKDVITDKPFEYFDLLARSLLSITQKMNNIKVRIKDINPYYERFGFITNENGQEIISHNISLKGSCSDH